MGRRARSVSGAFAVAAAMVPFALTGAAAAPGDVTFVPETQARENGVISADGGTVAWTGPVTTSAGAQLVGQVFARDLEAGTTVLVSATPTGAGGLGVSAVHSVSADGRLIAFTSAASDLVPGDTNAQQDVFVRDVVTGTTTRVSIANDGGQAASYSNGGYLSAAGRRVAFSSRAGNLVGGDKNRLSDVFVRDLSNGTTRRVSVGSRGQQSVRPAQATSISSDGRHVAFISNSASITNPTASHRFSVYVHDLPTGRTERVSVDRSGGVPDGRSLGGSMSADGRLVVFHSKAADLVSGDQDAEFDVFVRDRRRDRTEQVSVGRCGRGFSAASWDGAISDNGRRVAFTGDGTACVRDRRTDQG